MLNTNHFKLSFSCKFKILLHLQRPHKEKEEEKKKDAEYKVVLAHNTTNKTNTLEDFSVATRKQRSKHQTQTQAKQAFQA